VSTSAIWRCEVQRLWGSTASIFRVLLAYIFLFLFFFLLSLLLSSEDGGRKFLPKSLWISIGEHGVISRKIVLLSKRVYRHPRSRDSVVGIWTGYGLGGVGVRVPIVNNFLFSKPSRPVLGSPIMLSNGCRGLLYLGVKRPGRETDHSPATIVEVKEMWIYTSTPPYAFAA
jgi:hypothetical protein